MTNKYKLFQKFNNSSGDSFVILLFFMIFKGQIYLKFEKKKIKIIKILYIKKLA